MVTMRRATANDAAAIRALIRQVRINPTGLDWRHFLVTVDEHGRVVATGQVKRLRDGTRELASIATATDYRGQGLASAIINQLINETPRPLYLVCAERLGSFYTRFGFRQLSRGEMPPVLGREAALMDWLRRHVAPHMPRLLVMKIE
jgi:N-acetylglutamate synthase-like GNAT family acetyltransferase